MSAPIETPRPDELPAPVVDPDVAYGRFTRHTDECYECAHDDFCETGWALLGTWRAAENRAARRDAEIQAVKDCADDTYLPCGELDGED